MTDKRFYNTYIVYDNDELLWKRGESGDKLVVPRILIKDVIRFYHDSPEFAHPGRDETVRLIFRKYYFKNLTKTVGEYVKNCLVCKLTKKRQVQKMAPLESHTSTHCFQKISIDILGPYNTTRKGRKYILCVEDIFSKWVEAESFACIEGRDVVKFLKDNIFYRFGVPDTIISDNGPQFKSKTYRQLCNQYKINTLFTPTYHQQSNPVERRNQEIKKILRILLLGKPDNQWDVYLPEALGILRTRKNAATGVTPAIALLGYELPGAGEWNTPFYRKERLNCQINPKHQRDQKIRECQESYQRKYTDSTKKPKVTFSPGDQVMIRELRQLKESFAPVWTGPHEVIAKKSNLVYEISRDGKFTSIHINDLRPCPLGNVLTDDENTDMQESSSDSENSEQPDMDMSVSESPVANSGEIASHATLPAPPKTCRSDDLHSTNHRDSNPQPLNLADRNVSPELRDSSCKLRLYKPSSSRNNFPSIETFNIDPIQSHVSTFRSHLNVIPDMSRRPRRRVNPTKTCTLSCCANELDKVKSNNQH